MTTTNALLVPRLRPMMTGGGGTVLELLLGLATSVTAVLAAMAWRKPKDADASEPETPPPPPDDEEARDQDSRRGGA